MIVAEYTVICDGCGRGDLGSERSPIDAELRAQADGWTTDADVPLKHWCHDCTRTRQETNRA